MRDDTVTPSQLLKADWSALVRLAKSLGLRVRAGPEGHDERKREALVAKMLDRMIELEDSDARAREGLKHK